jgi:hypothetical protein
MEQFDDQTPNTQDKVQDNTTHQPSAPSTQMDPVSANALGHSLDIGTLGGSVDRGGMMINDTDELEDDEASEVHNNKGMSEYGDLDEDRPPVTET